MTDILLYGPVNDLSGYGTVSRNLAISLSNLGANVKVVVKEKLSIREHFEEITRLSETRHSGKPAILLISTPKKTRHYRAGALLTIVTNWETTRLPAEWVEKLNRYDCVFVPGSFNERVFVESGVKKPSIICGYGCDHLSPRHEQPPEDKFRFLSVFLWLPRKDYETLIRVFSSTFAPGEAELVLLTYKMTEGDWLAEILSEIETLAPRRQDIKIVEPNWQNLPDLYHQCHCLVNASHGEAFFLPGLEALSVGRPFITVAFGGQMDYATSKTAELVDYRLIDAEWGQWAQVNADALATSMRRVFENYDKALTKAQNAMKMLRERFTWTKSASVIKSRIEQMLSQKA